MAANSGGWGWKKITGLSRWSRESIREKSVSPRYTTPTFFFNAVTCIGKNYQADIGVNWSSLINNPPSSELKMTGTIFF